MSTANNTDVHLWREKEDDYYSPSIHRTADGSIGINVGGHVIVMPLETWHRLACVDEPLIRKAILEEREACAKLAEEFVPREINPHNATLSFENGYECAVGDVAAAIRARSQP